MQLTYKGVKIFSYQIFFSGVNDYYNNYIIIKMPKFSLSHSIMVKLTSIVTGEAVGLFN